MMVMAKIKRKVIPKAIRQAVYDRYDGRCGYCGCKISMKEMNVDHIDPVYLREADPDGAASLNDISNLMPACRMCNFYKSTFGIEKFRENLKTIPERLEKVFIYRLAKKYGIIKETDVPIEFYFEKHKERKENVEYGND